MDWKVDDDDEQQQSSVVPFIRYFDYFTRMDLLSCKTNSLVNYLFIFISLYAPVLSGGLRHQKISTDVSKFELNNLHVD